MNLFNGIVSAVFGVIFSSVVFAGEASYYNSVLTQGSRLVAGDPSKDEFFILGKQEPSSKRVASNQTYAAVVKRKKSLLQQKVAFHSVEASRRENIARIDNVLQHAMLQSQRQVSLHKAAQSHATPSIKMAGLSKKATALLVPHPFAGKSVAKINIRLQQTLNEPQAKKKRPRSLSVYSKAANKNMKSTLALR